MLVLPVQTAEMEYQLFIVMGAANISRMIKYDPVDLSLIRLGEPWQHLKLAQLHLLYATELEESEVLAMCKQGQLVNALRLLSRGYKFDPSRGDGGEWIALDEHSLH